MSGGSQEREYVLGTGPDELARLGFQHRVWSEAAFSAWERAGFGPGQTILDLGCGPGFASFDLAQLVGPAGSVLAIDVSQRFLDWLESQKLARGATNIETRLADVERLDLPPASLDGAYARWVLCWLQNPQAAVAAVARALRRGGCLVVQDYFNYETLTLAPKSRAFGRVIEAVAASYRQTGGDPDVGGQVPRWMRESGLEVVEIRPLSRIARPGSALWQWPTTFFRNYVPRLVEMGLLTPEEQRAFEEEWAQRSRDPDTFFVTPPMVEIIGRRP